MLGDVDGHHDHAALLALFHAQRLDAELEEASVHVQFFHAGRAAGGVHLFEQVVDLAAAQFGKGIFLIVSVQEKVEAIAKIAS
ncbi:hypothetical protein GCM10025794_15060 [Massilia kyonggiensis]